MPRRVVSREGQDVFTGWRRFLHFGPGQIAKVKRREHKRERRSARAEITAQLDEYAGAWAENEDGPWCKHCTCDVPAGVICDEDHGWPTVVKIMPDGTPVLMCLGHTSSAGLIIRLPAQRPADWASMTMRDVAVMLGYAT